MESRIRQIDQVIRNHEIVQRDEHAGKVQHASFVRVVYEGDPESDFQEFFIGSIEEKSPTACSWRHPRHPWASALGTSRRPKVSSTSASGVLKSKCRTALNGGGSGPSTKRSGINHVVASPEGEPTLMYIDPAPLVHEGHEPSGL